MSLPQVYNSTGFIICILDQKDWETIIYYNHEKGLGELVVLWVYESVNTREVDYRIRTLEEPSLWEPIDPVGYRDTVSPCFRTWEGKERRHSKYDVLDGTHFCSNL